MKKKFCIVICIIIIVSINFISNNGKANLKIIYKDSYFSNFTVFDGKVFINCELVIKNVNSEDKIFKLNATMKDDVTTGLLVNENLEGFDSEYIEKEFKIDKKTTSSFLVVFIGDFGGTNTKHNRNLPEITIIEVKK